MRRGQAALTCLVVTLALAPLATANLTALGIADHALLYDAYELPKFVVAFAGALIACAVWALGRRSEDAPATRTVPALWMLLAFLGLVGVATLTSTDPLLSILGQSERLEGLVTAALYTLLFFLGLQLVRGWRDLERLAVAAVIAGAAVAAYGLAQFFGIDPTHYVYVQLGFDTQRAFATFGNPNFLAGYLVLTAPPAFAMTRRVRAAWKRIAFGAAALLISGALVATFTRGAWLAAAVECGVALAFVLSRRSRGLSARNVAVFAFALVVVLGVAGISLARSGEANVVKRVTALSSAGTEERLFVWSTAADAVASEPLVGYGPDAFLTAFRANRRADYVELFGSVATVNNAHDWPLQIAATVGVPAALLFFGAIALVLWRSGRRVRGAEADDATGESPPAAMGLAVHSAVWLGCLGYVVHMLMNVAVHGATTAFFVFLGALAASYATGERTEPRRWSAAAARAASIVVLVGGLVTSGALLVGDHAYLESRIAYHAGDFASSAAQAEDAASVVPTSPKYRRGIAQALAASWYADEDADREAFDEALAAFDAMLERHPDDYAGNAWAAALAAGGYNRYGDETLAGIARERASRACDLDPVSESMTLLAAGSVEEFAIQRARAVPALP